MTVLLVLMGAARSPLVLLVAPAGALTGLAVAAIVAGFAVRQRRSANLLLWQRFGAIPMTLFSGVYFPVGALPAAVRAVVELTPLYHGVELCRGASLGTMTAAAAFVHVGYLLLLTAAGVAWSSWAFDRQLVG